MDARRYGDRVIGAEQRGIRLDRVFGPAGRQAPRVTVAGPRPQRGQHAPQFLCPPACVTETTATVALRQGIAGMYRVGQGDAGRGMHRPRR